MARQEQRRATAAERLTFGRRHKGGDGLQEDEDAHGEEEEAIEKAPEELGALPSVRHAVRMVLDRVMGGGGGARGGLEKKRGSGCVAVWTRHVAREAVDGGAPCSWSARPSTQWLKRGRR